MIRLAFQRCRNSSMLLKWLSVAVSKVLPQRPATAQTTPTTTAPATDRLDTHTHTHTHMNTQEIRERWGWEDDAANTVLAAGAEKHALAAGAEKHGGCGYAEKAGRWKCRRPQLSL